MLTGNWKSTRGVYGTDSARDPNCSRKNADSRTRSSTLSKAEAISVVSNGLAMADHYGTEMPRAGAVTSGIVGSIVKDRCKIRSSGRSVTGGRERVDRLDATPCAASFVIAIAGNSASP